jgi:membrane-bound serine protease (ClpP class)
VEYLLLPNVSYILVVGGLLMTILAFFAPGTGVIEFVAILALFLGGYGVVSQPINYWAVIILLVGVIPFILALRKSHNLLYLVISIAALVIGSAYLFNTGVWWQPGVHPLLALIVSVLAGGFLWIIGRKGLDASAIKPRNKLEEVIGASGAAQTEITPTGGSVYVGGENWSARSQKNIPNKARIQVLRREGFILEVEEIPRFTPTPAPENQDTQE